MSAIAGDLLGLGSLGCCWGCFFLMVWLWGGHGVLFPLGLCDCVLPWGRRSLLLASVTQCFSWCMDMWGVFRW